MMCLSRLPALRDIFHIPVTRYSLFMLNTNQPTNYSGCVYRSSSNEKELSGTVGSFYSPDALAVTQPAVSKRRGNEED